MSFILYIRYIHTSRTAGDFATLLETIQLSSAIGIGLALHVVIVIGTAAVSDKERCAHKRGGCSADFLDFGDVIWHRRRVDEDVLTESVGGVELASRIFSWQKESNDILRFSGRHLVGCLKAGWCSIPD